MEGRLGEREMGREGEKKKEVGDRRRKTCKAHLLKEVLLEHQSWTAKRELRGLFSGTNPPGDYL